MALALSANQRLDVQQLRRKQLEHENKRYAHFEQILKLCHSHIQKAAERNVDKCFYRVRAFQMGLPVLSKSNMNACIMYLIFNLRRDGLAVDFLYPDNLFIRWGEVQKDTKATTEKYLATQPIQTKQKEPEQVPAQLPVKTKQEKLLDIDKTICRNVPSDQDFAKSKIVYDTEALDSLKAMADKIKRKGAV